MEETIKEQCIKKWYHGHSHSIYQYVFYMIGDHHQSLDIMQDTFIKAYEKMDNFEGLCDEKTWLIKIARNLTIDYLRKTKPIKYFFQSLPSFLSDRDTTHDTIELEEDIKLLYKALSRLPTSYREVIILRKIKDLSIKETASILEWKESRVKTMLFRGLKQLKNQLVEEGYTHETV